MEGMLFKESFSIFQLIITTIVTAVLVFIWAFHRHMRKNLEELVKLPTIVVCGPRTSGKTSFVKWLTGSEVLSHPIEDHLNIGYLQDGEKKIQVLDGIDTKNIEQIKKLNCKLVIYIFDPSPSSAPVSEQIEEFEKIKKAFKNIQILPLINKIDIADKEKLNEIESKLSRLHRISMKASDGLDRLKTEILGILG